MLGFEYVASLQYMVCHVGKSSFITEFATVKMMNFVVKSKNTLLYMLKNRNFHITIVSYHK